MWHWFIGKYDTDEVESFIKESLHMKTLNHINVMRLVGVCLDADTAPYIVLPYMAGIRKQFKYFWPVLGVHVHTCNYYLTCICPSI